MRMPHAPRHRAHRHRARTWVLVLAVSLLGLAGCRERTDVSADARAKAGMCVAKDLRDGNDLAPDLSTAVGCATAHGWEIVGTAKLPAQFRAKGSRTERLKRRTELTNVDNKTQTALAKRFWSAGFKACGRVLAGYLRPPAFTLTGGAVPGMNLQPYVRNVSTGWVNATSPSRWVAGDQRYVCSVRYGSDIEKNGHGTLMPVASMDTHPAIHGLFDSTFPAGRRRCGLTVPDSTRLASRACTTRHDVEHLWLFTPTGPLAHANEAALTKACATTYERFGHPIPKGASMAVGTFSKSRDRTCVLLFDEPTTAWKAFS